MTLYEMTKEMQAIYSALSDAELSDEEREQIVADNAEAIGADDKLNSYGVIIRQLEADAASLKTEIDRMTALKKRIEASVSQMKDRVDLFMQATDTDRVQTDRFLFSYRLCPEKVVTDETVLPKKWWRKVVKTEPDKEAIKAAIRGGARIKGAVIIRERKIQIK